MKKKEVQGREGDNFSRVINRVEATSLILTEVVKKLRFNRADPRLLFRIALFYDI